MNLLKKARKSLKKLNKKILKFFLAITLSLPGILFCAEEDKYLDENIENWQVHAELARVYSYQKKYEASIKEFKEALKDEALKDNPEKLDLLLELSSVYAYQGNQKESEKILDSFKGNFSTENIKKVANIYANLKDYPHAEAYYQKYLKASPKDDAIRLKYAEMLSWQKKYEESIVEYQKILASRPDDDQVRRRYGLVLIWMGEQEKGAEELKKTLHD